MNLYETIALKLLFWQEDNLKEQLYCSQSPWEEQQTREELADVNYQIKSFKFGGTNEKVD